MFAGELRHMIKIEKPTYGRGTSGGKTVTWTKVAEVWAAIEPIRGREYIEAQKVASEITTRIRIRHRSDLKPNMRVEHLSTGELYEIVSVIPIRTMGSELHLMCKAVV